MSFIPRITCRRCGRQYSGIHSRCPYCGTRRVQASARTPAPAPGGEGGADTAAASANTRWQLIFGVILLAAVILAVIVLVSSNLNGAVRNTPTPTLPPVTAPPSATPSPTPTPTPTPAVTGVQITCFGEQTSDFTTTAGLQTSLKAIVYPLDLDPAPTVTWTSSDENVATVDDTGKVTAVAAGTATVTPTCYGATQTCIVRVKAG